MKGKTAQKNKSIYMDYAAATPVSSEVISAMKPFLSEQFGNPGSIHNLGILANKALEKGRKDIAMVLGAKTEEIIFTSGGTESDNLAILGAANFFKRISKGKKLHIITTKIEHHAVLKPIKFLEMNGFEVTYISVSKKGIVNVTDIKKAIKENTILISVMYANNETGSIQPIREIGNMIKEFREDRAYPLFHTDACQAPGALNLQVSNLRTDLMSFSGAKIYGPKGSGFLYIKKGTHIDPIIFGGEQEGGLRSGTQNVPEIAGMAKAFKMADEKRKDESARLLKLRDYFISSVKKAITKCELNGDEKLRLPNNANIYFQGISGEQLVIELDAKGVMISAGSACSSREDTPSHVLLSMYGSEERANSSVRFTFGRDTDKKKIDFVIKTLKDIIKRLRSQKKEV